jgi:hypothetical protein
MIGPQFIETQVGNLEESQKEQYGSEAIFGMFQLEDQVSRDMKKQNVD